MKRVETEPRKHQYTVNHVDIYRLSKNSSFSFLICTFECGKYTVGEWENSLYQSLIAH